ncbi:TetR/AcrR family transcriptional regulator [Kitasatospora sp. NPDC051170]|uniref:TetR/AcrR family transcriptional regulator n=1 Tax=Streptomycetaceae TaxID=2062 RepID=UPI0022772F2B|nr:TetR/AcrR family transcriptional regulator [Streptomyces sp. NRRL WC-3742]
MLDATLSLLAEVGSEVLSMETVATRAAVAKTTIYRRWKTKDELLVAAICSLRGEMPGLPTSTDLREALLECVKGMQQMHDDPRYLRLVPRLYGVADLHPELYRQYVNQAIAPRRDIVLQVLQQGVAEGSIRKDANLRLAMDLLLGPVLIRSFRSSGADPTDPSYSELDPAELVDAVLDGLAPR